MIMMLPLCIFLQLLFGTSLVSFQFAESVLLPQQASFNDLRGASGGVGKTFVEDGEEKANIGGGDGGGTGNISEALNDAEERLKKQRSFIPQRNEDGIPRPIPPEVEKALPPEAVAKIRAIIADRSLTPQLVQERIDQVITSLPDHVLDRIPQPPGFDQLPTEVVARLKAISRQRGKSWADKQQELQKYVSSLPFDQQAVVRQGIGLPPPPPNFKRLGPGTGPQPGMPTMPGGGGMGGIPMPGGMPMPMMPMTGGPRGGGMPRGMPMPGGLQGPVPPTMGR